MGVGRPSEKLGREQRLLAEAVIASNNTGKLIAQVESSLPALKEARARFLHGCAALINDPDTPLADYFPNPEDYYTALARLGRNPGKDPRDAQNTTARMAKLLARLHTTDTLVYLRTDEHDNRLLGPQYAIGRIASTPKARLIPSSGSFSQPQLVIDVLTGTVSGTPRVSELTMDEIAGAVDRWGSPGTRSPLVAVGAEAIRPHVEDAYAARRDDQYGTERILAALCVSGVKLTELGVEPSEALNRADTLQHGLRAFYRGELPYGSQLAQLVPLYESNATALQDTDATLYTVRGTVLAHREAPGSLPITFVDDYRLLEQSQTADTLQQRLQHPMFGAGPKRSQP